MGIETPFATTALVPKRSGLPPAGWRVVVLLDEQAVVRVFAAGARVVVGRSAGVDLRIDEPTVSRRHAVLHLARSLRIEDLGSANGTWVRGGQVAVGETHALQPGEPFEIGSVSVVVQASPVAPSAEAGAGGQAAAATAAPPTAPDQATESGRAGPRAAAIAEASESAEDVPGSATLASAPPAEGVPERFLARIAESDLSILIEGETGVGKEVLARRLHRLSRRADGPFIGISCAALPEHLLESELFGYERGAFTGAQQAKPGLFEAAEGGTLFLDEVGELPLAVQAKLLRAIETREVLRLGGVKPRPYDARFVAATNRDLDAEVAAGRFRADLYFRLNGYAILLPPLRERRAEIPGLARALIEQAAARSGPAAPPELTPACIDVLSQHEWPGNVRELRNVVELALVLCGGGPLGPEHMVLALARPRGASAALAEARAPARGSGSAGAPASDASAPAAAPSGAGPGGKLAAPAGGPASPSSLRPSSTSPPSTGAPEEAAAVLRDQLDQLERQRIIDTLERCGGNQTQAAVLLGMSRRTLVSRLDRYGLPRPRKGHGG